MWDSPSNHIPGLSWDIILLEQGGLWEKILTWAKFSQLAGYIDQLKEARNYPVRNALIRWMVQKKKFQAWRSSGNNIHIDLDTLWIHIQAGGIHAGKNSTLSAHLPFREIDTATWETLVHQRWLPEDDILEGRLHINDNEKSEWTSTHIKNIILEQKSLFLDKFWSIDALSTRRSEVVDWIASGWHLPGSMIVEHIGTLEQKNQRRFALDLLLIAEDLSIKLSDQMTEGSGWFESAQASQQFYAATKNIIHTPRYYEAIKIVRIVLENIDMSADRSDWWNSFCSDWWEKGWNDISLFGFMHENRIARIPIVTSRHLTPHGLGDIIPKIPKSDYQMVDSVIDSYDIFNKTMQEIERIMWENPLDMTAFLKLFLSLSDIFVSEISHGESYISRLRKISAQLRDTSHIPPELNEEIAQLLSDMERVYSETIQNLSSNTSQTPQVVDVKFDARYQEIAEKVNPKSPCYDTELCMSNSWVRVVACPDPHQWSMLYAAKRLGLIRGKPLITVVWGCKFLENPERLDWFVTKIISLSDSNAANLCTPGTQSGLWTLFGRQNALYKEKTKNTPRSEKMHMFGFVPMESAIYPDNPLLDVDKSPYAVATDVVAIGKTEWWSTPGAAGYFQKMGLFWERLVGENNRHTSESQSSPHIIIVANGGAFTIAELNAWLARSARPIFVKDTGRFADLAISMIQHSASWNNLDHETLFAKIHELIMDIPDNGQLLRDFENVRWREEIIEFSHHISWDNLSESSITTLENIDQALEKNISTK